MSKMTKTTVITWSGNQINNTPVEHKRMFIEPMWIGLQAQIAKGATDGQSRTVELPDGGREHSMDWIDQESAQSWLDFVLATLREHHGPDRTFQSGVIQDIPV